uniref:Uncharacterized protein n=1 Tax=Ralstonia syzygii R24 TaxID=907261 RepID=G3ACD7_9RALS|nr:conserved hypothetical protein [Ralstonia syzygii R24]
MMVGTHVPLRLHVVMGVLSPKKKKKERDTPAPPSTP